MRIPRPRRATGPRRTSSLRDRLRGPWRIAVAEASMAPAVEDGDWLLVDPTVARWPRHGTIVVFREPDGGALAVKRVAGRPGERVPFETGYIELADDEAWLLSDATAPETARRPASASPSIRAATDRSRSNCSSHGPGSATPHGAGSDRCGGLQRRLADAGLTPRDRRGHPRPRRHGVRPGGTPTHPILDQSGVVLRGPRDGRRRRVDRLPPGDRVRGAPPGRRGHARPDPLHGCVVDRYRRLAP